MTRFALRLLTITLLWAYTLAAARSIVEEERTFFSEGRRIASGLSELLSIYGNALFVTPSSSPLHQRPPKHLKIALVGLPRTSTGSMIEALKMLGYTTVHMDEYLENADLFAGLSSSGNSNDNNKMDTFVTQIGERGFDALYYWSLDFVKWAAATPHKDDDNDDVKVILTVRDSPQKWAKSFQSVGSSWETLWFSRPFIWWKPLAQLASSPLAPLLKEFNRAGDTKEGLEEYYLHHIQRVQEIVPADRLLVFNAKQGWEPLCQFLDQPVPTADTPEESKQPIPFPHANERYLLQLENNIMWTITWIWPVFPVLFLYAIWSLGRRMVVFATGILSKTKKTPAQKTAKKEL